MRKALKARSQDVLIYLTGKLPPVKLLPPLGRLLPPWLGLG